MHLASSGKQTFCASGHPSPSLLFRIIGGAVGVSVGQAVYTSVLKMKIDRIPELSGIDTSPAALAQSIRMLKHMPVNTFDDYCFLFLFE